MLAIADLVHTQNSVTIGQFEQKHFSEKFADGGRKKSSKNMFAMA